MENFKEIAEKCLAGELSGIFKNRKGESIPSIGLFRASSKKYPYTFYYSCYVTINGKYINSNELSEYDIIDFIPNNMQEQIKIDIPEGKVPVMEQTENGINITWANKDITYKQVLDYLNENHQLIQYQANVMVNKIDSDFLRKVNVIGKLTNIRNYFGKCNKTEKGYHICHNINIYDYSFEFIVREFCIGDPHEIVFAKKEHAEQAIKMLGDELKYLFEPW